MKETKTTVVEALNAGDNIKRYQNAFANIYDYKLRPDFVYGREDIEYLKKIANIQFTVAQATLLNNRINESGLSPEELAYHDYIKKHLSGRYMAYVTMTYKSPDSNNIEKVTTICYLDKPNDNLVEKMQKIFTKDKVIKVEINRVVLTWFHNTYSYHCAKDGNHAPDGRPWCKYKITTQYWG